MNLPNLRLMRAYGNEGVFFQKTASPPPLAPRAALLAEAQMELQRLEELKTTAMHLEAQRMNARARLMELAQMEQTINNAHHTRAPMILGSNYSDYPVGMTEGMVRLASACGADMAKRAEEENAFGQRVKKFVATKGGLSGTTLGVHNAIAKPLALAGTAAGLYAAGKGLQKGLNWLGQEPRTPTYNTGGNQLAQDVNEYGQAQKRLPSSYY